MKPGLDPQGCGSSALRTTVIDAQSSLCVRPISAGIRILLKPHGVVEKRGLVAQSPAKLIGDMPANRSARFP